MFLNWIPSKIIVCSTYLLIPLSFLACKSFYDTYIQLARQYKEVKLFKSRHNCVVMYRDKVFIGWPPIGKRLKSDIPKDRLEELYEPVLYFINTAKYSLDVAVMIITIKPIWKALADANCRGVKVRLLLNFDHCHGMHENIKDLLRKGTKKH